MLRATAIWLTLAGATLLPLAIALGSPLLAWRQPVYILAGLAGVVGMALLLLQPLLIGGHLPGLRGFRGRHLHRWVGGGLLVAIVLHVGGLWLTSPPDVVDALLLRSPTSFSVWGVAAMWAAVAAALVALRRRRMKPRLWRTLHMGLAAIVVIGSIVHALLIEGTMGTLSKALLCALVAMATVTVLWHKRPRSRT